MRTNNSKSRMLPFFLIAITLLCILTPTPVFASIDLFSTDGWNTVYPSNNQFDYLEDQQTASGSVSQDIVGDSTYPSFYTKSDGIDIAFRLRVNDVNYNKTTGNGFNNFAFVGIDGDFDGGIDFFLGVYDPTGNGRVGMYKADKDKANDSPSTTGIINPPVLQYVPIKSTNFSMIEAPGSNFSGDPDYFITFSLKISDINTKLDAINKSHIQINESTPLRYIVGTAAQDNSFNQDIAGINGIDSKDTTTWESLGVFSPAVSSDGSVVEYTVSFNSNGGDTEASPTSKTAEYNTSIDSLPTVPTRTGYTFAGWNTNSDGNSSIFDASTKLTGDITVYAQWTQDVTYTVSFNVDGGSAVSDQTIKQNQKATEPNPAPTKVGYCFDGWYIDNNFTTGFDFTNTSITQNTTIYAQWTINNYTVTFDKNAGDTDANPTTKTADYNTSIDSLPTAPTRTGHTFAGWNTNADGSGSIFDASTKLTGDITVYAQWSSVPVHTVSFNSNGGDTDANPTTKIVTDGSIVDSLPSEPTRTGYTFSGWNTLADGNGSTFNGSITVSSNTTVYAQWTINNYTVIFDKNVGDTDANPTTKTADYNTSIDSLPTAPTRTGHTFAGWNTNADGSGSIFDASTKLTGDITVYAQWSSVPVHTVSFNSNGGDTDANPTTKIVTDGSIVDSLPSEPTRTGYTFSGWNTLADGNGSTFNGSITVSSNTTVYAQWTINNYTVIFDKNAGDTDANPTTKTADYNTSIDSLPTAPTRTGYTFAGWNTNSDGSGSIFDASTKLTGDITVYAIWRIDKLKIKGYVYDAENRIITNAKIEMYVDNAAGSGLSALRETTADTTGYYEFDNISEGNYELMVTHADYEDAQKQVALNRDNTNVAGELTADLYLYDVIATFDASPSNLIGDGISTSTLKFYIATEDNTPLSNVNVSFSAPSGSFPNGTTDVTDDKGYATVVYRSEDISGVESQVVIVTATASDPTRGISLTREITVTFEPASITGVIEDKEGVIRNTKIIVSADFNDDGIVDFYAETFTDENGGYSIAIPEGNETYDIEVIRTFVFGGIPEEISFNQKSNAENISGTGDEKFVSEKTIVGVLKINNDEGEVVNLVEDMSNALDIKVYESGSTTELTNINDSIDSSTGKFSITGSDIESGKKYEIVYISEDGLLLGCSTVEVDTDGLMKIVDELIDPYGDITDQFGNPVVGAHVEIFWADTDRNKNKGRTPNDSITFPTVENFPPSDNENPQHSDEKGKYAYMVYPEGDYYLLVTKSGNETYTSPTISVEYDIVRHDIQMNKIVKSSSSTSKNRDRNIEGTVISNDTGEPIANVKVEIESDYDGDGKIDYTNMTKTDSYGEYNFTIPDDNNDYYLKINTAVEIDGRTDTLVYTQGIETNSKAKKAIVGVLRIPIEGSQVKKLSSETLNKIKIDLLGENENEIESVNIEFSDDSGIFEITGDGIEAGKKYYIKAYLENQYGQIIFAIIPLVVMEDGYLNIVSELIDPYGIISDQNNDPVKYANVKLYWADTERNKEKGRTPGELVYLPEIADFAPGNNSNPQSSDENGSYAFMVYAEGDYIIKVEKAGYDKYTSEVISVEYDVVEFDISMIKHDIDELGRVLHKPFIKGYPDGTFRTQRSVTRAEIAAIFARILELENDVTGEQCFDDVLSNHWASGYIEAITKYGLSITSSKNFRPDEPATRAEVLSVMAQLMNLSNIVENEDYKFSDIENHWAKGYINNAYSYYLINGYPDGTFDPDGTINRIETVIIVLRYLDRAGLTNIQSSFNDVNNDYWGLEYIEDSTRAHKSIIDEYGKETDVIIYDLGELW